MTGGTVGRPLRQLPTLAALLEHIAAAASLDDAILLGFSAGGTPDAAGDLELIVGRGRRGGTDGCSAPSVVRRAALSPLH